MAILTGAPVDVAWIATFDPFGLGDRFRRNRIKGKTQSGIQINSVAFVPVKKFHRL
jgi:hypothetical protein